MNCNIIRDLLPLYIDDCCSEESAALVREHLECCPACRKLYEGMRRQPEILQAEATPCRLTRINERKATMMQSILLFAALLLPVTVALEASTPLGRANGYWAISLLIPTTGFVLSIFNWYFVRIYQSRKQFSVASLITTLVLTCIGYVLIGMHYGWRIFDFANRTIVLLPGILLTALFCVLSKILSNTYAKLLGKE